MNEKSRLVLRIVACLYVMYLGGQLVVKMITDRPGNMFVMMAAGIFFLVAGGAIVFFSIKDLIKLNQRLAEETENAAGEEDEIEENLVETTADKEEESDTDVNRQVSLDIAEEDVDEPVDESGVAEDAEEDAQNVSEHTKEITSDTEER